MLCSTDLLLAESAIAKNATATGDWRKRPHGDAFNFWWYMTATGAPSVTIYVDYTIFDPAPSKHAGGTHDPASTDRTNYRTITLASAQTTKGSWTHVDTPSELLYPWTAYRVRVTEGAGAAVTTFTLAVCSNSAPGA